MASDRSGPRRVRVERNIYRRPTGVFEVGFKDASGKQRWRTVDGGITAARALRDQLVTQRNRREPIPDNARLRFDDAADEWLSGPVADLRQTTRDCYRNAVENHLRRRFGTKRLDAITPDDLAALVRDLRTDGRAEASIAIGSVRPSVFGSWWKPGWLCCPAVRDGSPEGASGSDGRGAASRKGAP